ncbi:MAG TPA: PEP/pyruvate-binding domain-containing protein [Solirubrobacteraceae bacterium]|jgi:pyruvate,water dikinase
MNYVRSLAALSRSDEPQFGGKSAALGELLAAEIPVPPGFALSTAAYERFVAQSELAPVIERALSAGTAAAEPIAEAVRGAPVPDAVVDELAGAYRELGEPAVAVRSSAVGEDSAEATFAGQQETFLWVRGVDGVCAAVRDCWASLYSAPAIAYRARLGGATRPAMGVTVQEMVDAEISGVMFTCNPVSGDPSMIAINASWGLGLGVVGGEVTPDDYLVSKVTREVVREQIGTKAVQYVPRPSGDGAQRIEVAPERRQVGSLTPEAISSLVEVGRRIERHFGSHQDVEWAIPSSGEVFVVQSRPVTTVNKAAKPKPPRSAISLVMGTFGVEGEHGP